MSALVLGTVQFGLHYGINNKTGKVTTDQVLDLLKLAWESGIREIDTAQGYGNSEEILGDCFKKIPHNFIVHSKFSGLHKPIQDTINDSLKRLGIPKLGYLYFHQYSDYKTYRNENPNGELLVNCDGLAVSVYDEKEMKVASEDAFVKAIQLPLNVFDASLEKVELIKKCRSLGKKIYVRSVFLQGLLFMTKESLPEKLKNFEDPLRQLNSIIAQKNDLSMRDLALGFVNTITEVDGVLVGVDSSEHLKENLKSKDLKLSHSIISEIQKIKIQDKNLLLPKNWN